MMILGSVSSYADLELNPLRLVKSNVWIFQNMQRKNVTTCKVTAWASLQVIQNLFLSAFEIFLATSRCQFTYVWTNFKGSISRFHDDFGVGLIVVAWRIEITRKKYNIAFLEAFNRCFPAHLRFCSATARLQADSSTHQWCTRVAPWVWSCTLRPLTPESPRPRQIFEKSDTGHRDRSKKYICSYLWTAPRPVPTRIGEKSSKITKISTFSIFFEPFAPWLLPQRHRTINNAQNIHFFLVISIGHPTTRIWSWIHSGWWNQMSEFFKICNEKMSRHVK